MRSYAGDTSLPGGKAEPDDRTIEDTAVSMLLNFLLPERRCNDSRSVGKLLKRQEKGAASLYPGTIRSRKCHHRDPVGRLSVEVFPVQLNAGLSVVVLILDNTLRTFFDKSKLTLFMQPILNDAEVASLFSHPLASFLSTKPPFPAEPELVEVPYHSYKDWTSPGPNDTTWTTRSHQFLTGREAGGIKPVFGLTASIMIRVSMIAYGHPPEFDIYPPGIEAPTLKARLAWAMLSRPQLREACQQEGLKVDWDRLRRIAGVKEDRNVRHDPRSKL
ncbi:hypothetical protein C0993_007493 [Termitomyces sp. T159_Od127]|nr:hypothetical protein C0993_007493 [Termitomyces sp. T159_Od127]